MEDWDLWGRDSELAEARAALDDARVVAVLGPPGIGKSRFAEELLAAQPFLALVASRSLRRVPLGAFAPYMRQTVTASESGGPALTAMLSDAVDALEATGSSPVFVDNAQWLDDMSAAALEQVLSRPGSSALIALRSGEPIAHPIQKLVSSDRCKVINLGPLDRSAVDDLLDEAVGPLDEVSRRRIFDATAGIPELLRVLVDSALPAGDIHRADDRWSWNDRLTAVHGDDLADRVLPYLDEDVHRSLRILAISEPIPLDVASTLLGAPQLVALERSGLVAVRDDSVYAHPPLVGEIVRSGLGPIERREISAMVIGLLGDDAAADDLGPHFWRWLLDAGVHARLGTSADELLDAAESAVSRGELQLATRLVEAARGDGDVLRAELQSGLIAASLGERGPAIRALEPISLDDSLPPAVRRRSLVGALRVADRPLVDRAGVTVAELLADPDPDGTDELRAAWAAALGFVGRLREAAEIARPLRAHADPTIRLRGAAPATAWLLAEGRCEEAVSSAMQDWEDAAEAGTEHADAQRWAAVTVFSAHLGAGHLHELGEMLAAAGDSPAFWVRAMRGRWLLMRGHAGDALTELAAAAAHGADDPLWTGWALALLAEAHALTGSADEALGERIEQAEPPPGVAAHDFQRASAWSLVASGNLVGARAKLASLATMHAENHHVTFEAVLRYDLLRLGADGRNARRLDAVCLQWDSRLAPPVAAHARGRLTRDAALLETAANDFDAIGADLYAAEAWADAATSHRRAGHSDSHRRCSAASALAAARCGGPSTPIIDGMGAAVRLTPREREVAHRAAVGATSREIALALGISVRTVDNLLGRVYVKLGIPGRTELPRVMGTPRLEA